MRIAFFIYAGIILILSLYPLAFDWTRHPGWMPPFESIHSRSDWFDVVANFFFYLPLGFTAVAAWSRRPGPRAILWATLLGTVLAYGIEVAQLYLPRRFSNWRDIILNAIGTAAGAWIATWPVWHRLQRRHSMASLGVSPTGWWLTACWITWLTFPFYPAFQMVQLRRAVEHMQEEIADPTFPILLAGAHFFGGAILASLSSARGMVRWLVPTLAAGAIGWMMLIQGLRFSPGRLLATLAGFGLAMLFQLPRRRGLMAALICGWLGFYVFYPFGFGGPARDFHWALAEGLSRNTLVTVIRDYSGKLFLISAALWSLRRAGWMPARAGLAVLSLIALGEWSQRYGTSRTPSLNDLLIGAAAAGIVLALERWSPSR